MNVAVPLGARIMNVNCTNKNPNDLRTDFYTLSAYRTSEVRACRDGPHWPFLLVDLHVHALHEKRGP